MSLPFSKFGASRLANFRRVEDNNPLEVPTQIIPASTGDGAIV
jgi:hypothetical protein